MNIKTAHNYKLLYFILFLLLFPLIGCISQVLFPELLESVDRTLDDANHTLQKEKGTSELMRQCARGDIAGVKLLLESGADLNKKNENGYTPLMFAAEYGNLAITKLLIEQGADTTTKNKYGHTALFLAALKSFENPDKAQAHFSVVSESNYVGESDSDGVISYLVERNAPIFESNQHDRDAAYTGKAYYNLAELLEKEKKYLAARDNYKVAAMNFVLASELYKKTHEVGKRVERMANIATFIGVVTLPVLEEANQRYQNRILNRRMANAAALRDAKKYGLNQQQTLDLVSKYRTDLNSLPPLDLKITDFPLNQSTNIPPYTPEAGKINSDNIYLQLAKINRDKSLLTYMILKCYESEHYDKEFNECLNWAKATIKQPIK